jgi:hypothetical protein
MEWRQFLGRFRPAAVPGPAAAAGVPADRRVEAAAELAPVFALLADVETEIAAITADGAEQARRIRRDAERTAAAMAAEAESTARPIRAAAAGRDGSGAEQAVDVAAPGVDGLLVAERLPALVEHALAEVRDLLDRPTPSRYTQSAADEA